MTRARMKRRRGASAKATAKKQREAATQKSRHILVVIFFGSGATSLVYETLWVRQLHLSFGTTQLAVSTVLAAFMGGLALGGFGAARFAPRVARPLAVYAALELFIALYALVFPTLLRLIQPLSLSFWNAFEPSPVAFGTLQLLLFGALLIPPTVCMGATLPLLAGFVTVRADEAGLRVGRLYGANTMGAVFGAWLAGFVLLPKLGLTATAGWAAVATLVLAGAAFALSRVTPSVQAAPTKATEHGTEGLPALLFIAALAGFASLLYEVAWFRLMSLILGGSAYAFSIMLLSFLIGIGIGGWAAGDRADRALRRGGDTLVLRRLAWLQIGVATLSWAAMFLYGELPFMFVRLYDKVGEGGGSLWLIKLVLSAGIMTPPALLMGATFPFLVRAAAGSAGALSRPVGLIYGVNTLGAVLGAAAGGLLLLPALHVRGVVLAAISINLVAALVAVAGTIERKRVAGWGLALASLLALLHWQKPPWDRLLMTSGMYQYVTDMDDLSRQGVLDYAVQRFRGLVLRRRPLLRGDRRARAWRAEHLARQ